MAESVKYKDLQKGTINRAVLTINTDASNAMNITRPMWVDVRLYISVSVCVFTLCV